MKIFTADYVFPVCADPIKNGVVIADDLGKIISVTDQLPPDAENAPVEHLQGIICPGFINTHCHVELSHLKNKIARGGGLVNFIKDVMQVRNAGSDEIAAAAAAADNELYENGIVAVGDIVNSNATIPVKAKSKLYYHTFVEV